MILLNCHLSKICPWQYHKTSIWHIFFSTGNQFFWGFRPGIDTMWKTRHGLNSRDLQTDHLSHHIAGQMFLKQMSQHYPLLVQYRNLQKGLSSLLLVNSHNWPTHNRSTLYWPTHNWPTNSNSCFILLGESAITPTTQIEMANSAQQRELNLQSCETQMMTQI